MFETNATEGRTYVLTRTAAASWLRETDTTRARRAQATDLYFVADLHSNEFPATYATAQHLIHGAGMFTFVVERDGAPIGYASGHVEGDGTASLDFMAVAENARGVGDGRVLLAATMAALFEEAGLEELRLFVEEHRKPAIRFYEKHGFTRVNG